MIFIFGLLKKHEMEKGRHPRWEKAGGERKIIDR
jgi:hypothetical protein